MKAPDVPLYDPRARTAARKPTVVDRLLEKEKSRVARRAADTAFRKAVIARDGLVDRITGEKLVKTTVAVLNRLEVHHLEGRATQATRYDPRNGIVVGLLTHMKLTTHVWQIINAQQTFVAVDGETYADASGQLEVWDTETGIRRWV